MKFLIQYNLMNEQQLELTRKAVEKYPHVFCGLIPFQREFTANEPIEGTDYIPYGSTLMSTLGMELGWKGLHLNLKKFNYSAALSNRDDMLNSNVMRLDDAVEMLSASRAGEMWFTRPSEDLKQFSGQVIEGPECYEWFLSMLECETSGTYKLEPETPIVLCEPQNIKAEWRWFIVGGKVVSGSMYRSHNQLRKERAVEQNLIDEAQALADKWLPDECCVMDLALVGDDLKVIEFNCINSSGFYDNDVNAIFDALWKYHN